MNKSHQEYLYNLYGEWQNGIIDTDSSTVQKITDRAFLEKTAFLKVKGTIIYNNEEISAIGSIEPSFTEMAHLQLLTGRMCENADEIVMEKSLLSLLQLDEQLNQTIPLTIQTPQGQTEKEYTLVGIMSNYSLNWPHSSSLVSAFVSETPITSAYNIFINWQSGHENTIEAIGIQKGDFIYNQHLELSQKQSILPLYLQLILLLTAFVLSFLLILNQLKKKQTEIHTLTALGCDQADLNKQLIRIYLIPIISAIPIALLISPVSMHFFLNLFQPYFSYELFMYINPLAWLLLSVIYLCLPLSCILLSIRLLFRMDTNKKNQRNHQAPTFKTSYDTLNDCRIFLRILKNNPSFTYRWLLILTLSTFVLLFSMTQIFYKERAYQTLINTVSYDYEFMLTNKNAQGFQQSQLKQMEQLAGIEAVASYKTASYIIEYPTMADSPFYQRFADKNGLSIQVMGINEENTSLLQQLAVPDDKIDTLLTDHQAILLAPVYDCQQICTIMINRNSLISNHEYMETTLQPNNQVTLIDEENSTSQQVTLCYITHSIPLKAYQQVHAFTLFVHESLLPRTDYDTVYVKADSISNEVSELFMNQIADNHSLMSFTNQRIEKQKYQAQFTDSFLFYSLIIVLCLLTDMIALSLLFQTFYHSNRFERTTLYLLGMDTSQIRKLYLNHFLTISTLLRLLCFIIVITVLLIANKHALIQADEIFLDVIPIWELLIAVFLECLLHISMIFMQYKTRNQSRGDFS